MARSYRFFSEKIRFEDMVLKTHEMIGFAEKVDVDIFFQLKKVLRVKPGDAVIFLPVQGPQKGSEFHFVFRGVEDGEFLFEYIKKVENKNELNFGLELVVCLPNKPAKLDFILEKAVELGATKVSMVEGDFSQMKHHLRPERLFKIMKEAAEQSERAFVPVAEFQKKLVDYLSKIRDEKKGLVLVAMERKNGENLQEVLAGKVFSKDDHVIVVIGPEGGFSEGEKNLICEADFSCYHLGKRILRMETAAILSLGMVAFHQ